MTFSQNDTDSLICIPIEHLRKAAVELVEYDYCQIERDSLRLTIGDLSQIISSKDSMIKLEQSIKNKTLTALDSLGIVTAGLVTEVELLNEDNFKLKKERNTLGAIMLSSILLLILF